MRAFLVSLAVMACDGTILSTRPTSEQPESVPETPVDRPVSELGDGFPNFEATTRVELRRLTTEQYVVSVQSLLQLPARVTPTIDPVSSVAGLPAIGASSAVVSPGGVARFEEAARALARQAFSTTASRQRLVPCTPTGVTDSTCFRSFVTSFGARAFRRALSSDEVDRYLSLTQALGSTTTDPWDVLETTTTAFLQSPNFLYLVEVGEPDPSVTGRSRFTNDELAARLSYFLTNDAPDDALRAAASTGQLQTIEGLRREAERLLNRPGARRAVRTVFGASWSLDGLETLTRPLPLYPKFSPTLGAALEEETLRTVEDLVFDRDADFRELFDQRVTFVNSELAAFYELPAPSGGGFSRVVLPDGPRRGLLGHAGVLAVRDHADKTSPTTRGLFVLTRLLCQKVPLSPPSGLVIPKPPQGMLTARQRLEEHSTNPTCAGCHRQMDSIGLTLERFDALGVHRTTEYGMPIDDDGTLGGIAYDGAAGLGALIRQAPATTACLDQSLFGAAVGHLPNEFDRDSFRETHRAFEASGARVKSLLLAIVTSDSFRFPPAP